MRYNADAANDTSSGLFPAGIYDFQVVAAEEQTSRSGNEMVKLTLHVFNDAGAKRTLFDYLVATDRAVFKIKAFAQATGLADKFESGELDAVDMEGRSGRLKLGVEAASGSYPEKNKVDAYLAAAPGAGKPYVRPTRSKPVMSNDDLSDQIPF